MSKPFHVLLEDEEYGKLEKLRSSMGLRSRGEVVRELIRAAGRKKLELPPAPEPVRPAVDAMDALEDETPAPPKREFKRVDLV